MPGWAPVLYSNFSPVAHLPPDRVYMLMLLSPFIPLSPSPTVSTSPFLIFASPFLHTIFLESMKVKVLVTQSCLTLWDPMDCSPLGSSVHGILQFFHARILEWAAIPSPGDLPDPGIEPGSPALQAESLPPEPLGKPHKYDICFSLSDLLYSV